MAKSKHTLSKNQKLVSRIESIAAGGQGVCKHEGTPIFVDRGVPGDLAELQLYDVRKDFAHARVVKILEGSPMRVEPPCKLFKVCGGCQWQHIKYEEQLLLKTDIVRQVIQRIAGLDPSIVRPALAADEPLHYRNKVQFPVSHPQNSNRILAGYFKEGSHELVNIKHCPVQPEKLDELLERAKEAAEYAGLSAYDEKSHSGLLRHLFFRHSDFFKTTLLTIVLNAQQDQLQELQGRLRAFVKEMDRGDLLGICANFNPSRGNRIMGNQTICLSGQDYIVEKLASKHENAPDLLKAGIDFRLSPASFFQVNSAQAVRLMDLVLDEVLLHLGDDVGHKPVPLIIDAYAGVATIAQWVAPLAQKVLAIEEVEDAIDDARGILRTNGIDNVEMIHGTVESSFADLVKQEQKADIVILDPPRKGVDKSALEAAVALSPAKIIYVSCNPATLARDLKILQELNYETVSVQPVDLFPMTYHVESVSVLRRTVFSQG